MAEVETCAALPSEEEGEDDLSAEITNRTAAGVVSSTEYDALGRPVAQFDGRGNRAAYAYDARGRVVSATDAAGNVTKFGYDARGRRTSVTDPLGNAVATAYDSEGRVLSVRGAACPVDWGYDAWGDRVSMATYRDGSLAQGDVTQWLRDAATGLVTNRVSADGRRTAYAYDALGRPVRRTDARGIVTDYAYDAAGDLAQVSHSDGTPSAAFARDRAGRLVAAVTDGVSTNLLAYDAFGAVTNETQNGVAIERTYDGCGRLASMNGVAYGYDALGRLASVEADGLSFTWLRVPGTDLLAGYVCGDFRRTVAYEPKRDLVAAVTNAFGDAVISSFGYGNDAAGRRVMIKRGGSAFGDLAGSADSYGYDARSEVVSMLREKDGAEVCGFLEDFAYDPIGNRTESAVYDEDGTRYASVYETNGRNQYVSRTVPGLAAARGDADARATVTVNGNPAFRLGGYFFGTAAFDNAAAPVEAQVETYAALPSDEEGGDDLVAAVTNRVHVPQSPEVFAYDANGNQTDVETPTGRWAVEWNAENRPIRWTCSDRTLLMAYDHMGRRVRYVETTGGITNRVATFLYDGYLCITRTVNGVTDRFLWDPTEPVATRPLAMVADGTAYLYAHDANKNVSELVNARTGEVAARYAYAAFGAMLMSEGLLARRNPFRFSSEYADDETGLIYYNWRHYDPVHGAWLGRDPIGVDGGANLYAFCGNDPINFSDKNGTRVNEFESVSLPYSGKRKRSLSFYTLDWYGLIERDSTFDVRTSVSVELLMGGKAEASFGSYGDLADATLKLWEYGTWRTYTEKKNVGVSSGLKARKKYICRARCKEACPLGLRTGTKTISIFERYVIGRTMAIDKEMGHYAADLRRTPNQYRWRSAEFWPDQQKFEQVYRECEKESRAACLSIEDM